MPFDVWSLSGKSVGFLVSPTLVTSDQLWNVELDLFKYQTNS